LRDIHALNLFGCSQLSAATRAWARPLVGRLPS
jgi:hypothetical protein